MDSVLTEDGRRFVALVYGEEGYTRLLARVPVRFSIITPDTGESHSFTLYAGETLEVYYGAGGGLVGGGPVTDHSRVGSSVLERSDSYSSNMPDMS